MKLGTLNLYCPVCGAAFEYGGTHAGNGTRFHRDFGVVCSSACLDAAELKYARMIFGKGDGPSVPRADQLREARAEGRREMLDSVRASLRDYPRAGGDAEVAREVERIAAEALKKRLRSILEAFRSAFYARGDHHYSGTDILMWLEVRVATLLVEERDQLTGLTPVAKADLDAVCAHDLAKPACATCGGTRVEGSGACHCGEAMDAKGPFAHSGHSPVEMTRACPDCSETVVGAETGRFDASRPNEANAPKAAGGWRSDPRAAEAVEYLLSIGFSADDMTAADAEAGGGGD